MDFVHIRHKVNIFYIKKLSTRSTYLKTIKKLKFIIVFKYHHITMEILLSQLARGQITIAQVVDAMGQQPFYSLKKQIAALNTLKHNNAEWGLPQEYVEDLQRKLAEMLHKKQAIDERIAKLKMVVISPKHVFDDQKRGQVMNETDISLAKLEVVCLERSIAIVQELLVKHQYYQVVCIKHLPALIQAWDAEKKRRQLPK